MPDTNICFLKLRKIVVYLHDNAFRGTGLQTQDWVEIQMRSHGMLFPDLTG
jgi:hypothetical protein